MQLEIPVVYASWKDRNGTTREWIVYAHCIDTTWPWWYPVTDMELGLCAQPSTPTPVLMGQLDLFP